MTHVKLTAAVLAAALATGCAGYDAGHDCEQAIACEEETHGSSAIDPAECERDSQEAYGSLSPEAQADWDERFARCSDEEGCAYVACVQEPSGLE